MLGLHATEGVATEGVRVAFEKARRRGYPPDRAPLVAHAAVALGGFPVLQVRWKLYLVHVRAAVAVAAVGLRLGGGGWGGHRRWVRRWWMLWVCLCE